MPPFSSGKPHHVDRPALLADIATRLLMADRPEDICRDIYARLAAHLDLDLFLSYVVDDDGRSLRLDCHDGVSNEHVSAIGRLRFGEGVCGTTAMRRVPTVVEHVQRSKDAMCATMKPLGIRAYACHPLLGRRGLIGTLSFGSRTRDRFARNELELMATIANQAAVAIERSRVTDERDRVERDLRESADALRTIFNSVYDAIVIHRPDGTILEVNDRFSEMYGGLSREAVIGLTVRESGISALTSEFDTLPGIWGRVMAGTPQLFEWTARRPHDGLEFAVEVFLRRVRWQGQDVILGSIRDIAERKRAEAALRDADRRKDDFIATLSHELRNPLAPIRYALPLIGNAPLEPAARRALDVVERQVDHLVRLVDDLLDVSRISRGKVELRREPVTLESVLNQAMEAAAPLIHSARHAFDVAVDSEPIWVDVDPHRIAQVVTNLLTNAAKYTPRGGRITLRAGLEGDRAVIRVRDNGVGIPPDALPTVFEMFQQLEAPRGGNGDAPRHRPIDTSQGGLGIGLALAKGLVEMHGGGIEAWSEGSGRGTEFTVWLPLAGATAAPSAGAGTPAASPNIAASAHEPPGDQAASAPRRLKVLVVDDNVDLVEMLGTVVSGLGHQVRKALDGRSALSAAVSFRPDVVLLDLGLPGIGGIEVARELRRHPELAGSRLVALTGWGQPEDRRQTREAGFDHHLTKPTDPETVERLLTDLAR